MSAPRFNPGFRFSVNDGVIVVVAGALSFGIGTFYPWLGVAVAFVVLHFFLFCNVFRISRPLELIWAALFVGAAIAASSEMLSWPLALVISAAVTPVFIAIEMRRPCYHGVFWQSVNPSLPEWWHDHGADSAAWGGRKDR